MPRRLLSIAAVSGQLHCRSPAIGPSTLRSRAYWRPGAYRRRPRTLWRKSKPADQFNLLEPDGRQGLRPTKRLKAGFEDLVDQVGGFGGAGARVVLEPFPKHGLLSPRP